MLDLLLRPDARLGDSAKGFKSLPGSSHTSSKVCRVPLGPRPVLVLALPAHLGSWLPVHGNPGQLGQTGAPQTQVHLITDVGQPQGHLVSAGRCQEVRHGLCWEVIPPTHPGVPGGTQGPERGGQWVTGGQQQTLVSLSSMSTLWSKGHFKCDPAG